MGSLDGAETCERVELVLLSQFSHLNIDVALYREHWLASHNLQPKQTDVVKKEISDQTIYKYLST